jgi:hypothetical protein
MAITKTRATSYAGASRGPERRGGGRRTRKPVKEKAALVATVNSVPSSGDGKRIKSEDVSTKPISTPRSYGVEPGQRGLSRSHVVLPLTQVNLFTE